MVAHYRFLAYFLEIISVDILSGCVRLLISLVVLAGQGKIIIAFLHISPYCLIFPKPKHSQHCACFF